MHLRLGENKMVKLMDYKWPAKPKWAFEGADPDLPLQEMKAKDWDDATLKRHHNAWRMGLYRKHAKAMDTARVLRQARLTKQQMKT
jgi:hypothetical protein